MKNRSWHQFIRSITPSIRQRGTVIRVVAKRLGLVYFGMVDQHTDEHDIIRGLTVSTNHIDAHYVVGQHDGYDIALADRFDAVKTPQGLVEHEWLIIRLTLAQNVTLPHLFLYATDGNGNFERYFQATTKLQDISGLFNTNAELGRRYRLYGAADQAHHIAEALHPGLVNLISTAFWPHSIEFGGDSIYYYISDRRLTQPAIEGAISNLIQLAELVEHSSPSDSD